jgi:protein transport protein SEC24
MVSFMTGCLSALSGGDIHFYPNFDATKDGMRFANDLKSHLSRTFGFDALLRLRVSNGLKIEDHYGNFFMRNSTDLEMAGIDSLKAFGVSVKHDGRLEERGDSYVQAALLYTTSSGARRIRVHNLQLGNTNELSQLFKMAEIDTTLNYLAKAAIAKMASVPLRDIRDEFTRTCVKVLVSYRMNCASSTAPGQVGGLSLWGFLIFEILRNYS